jgi:phosphoribosylanthranilate isomerase
MMPALVKICGLSTPETLDVALDVGADMVGFVFFPASPRHVSLGVARELGRRVAGRAQKVALAVDPDDETLENSIDALRPDMLQLHGKESISRVRDIKARFGLPVMKVIGVETKADMETVAGYAAVADRILFDARAPRDATRPGGLGVPFDWHLLEGLKLDVPFMVSGGINSDNVAEALRVTGAPGVDISSGVESAPGVKDPDMIRAFIRAVRAADATSSPLPAGGARELADHSRLQPGSTTR